MTELSRLERLQYRVAQAQFARDVTRTVVDRYRTYRKNRADSGKYFITIQETDDLFDRVTARLLEESDPRTKRRLSARLRNRWSSAMDRSVYELQLGYDEAFATQMRVGDHTVFVTIKRGGNVAESEPAPAPASGWLNQLLSDSVTPVPDPQTAHTQVIDLTKKITFECDSMTSRDAVLDMLAGIAEDFNKAERTTKFFVASPTGSWTYRNTIAYRPLDSVILRATQRDDIVADMKQFIDSEKRYVELGLPWHRGYLLYGPPGTGKTSLGRALASEFSFNVYYMSLSALESDAKLMDLMTSLDGERTMLIIEDIDIAHAARERNDTTKGVSLQGLLNALDGIATPHGLITFMTTNVRSVLDPALVRPGRVDYEMEVGHVDDVQLQDIVTRFHGSTVDLPAIKGEITPAEVVGLLKGDLDGDVLRDKLTTLINNANDRKTV